MNENREARLDQLLDLLAEEVAARLKGEPQLSGAPPDHDLLREETAEGPEEPQMPQEAAQSAFQTEGQPEREGTPEVEGQDLVTQTRPELPSASPVASHTARLLGRLALGLLALVIVINVPINRHGTTLATAMPDRRALVFRDGLVVKEEDDPEIYAYQDGQFRWISSLKAFEMRGYTWEDVHVVEDGFLERYEIGAPIHVILKCPDSPHIYRLEGDEKRWIVDIKAFEDEGYVWDDVELVSCSYLRTLPDGETIPPGQGPPPQP